MSMTWLVLLYTILLVFTNSLTPLQEFEIDGNYYSDGKTDWITVLDGYRMDRDTQTNWAEYQNQCFKDNIVTNPDIYTEYWDSGVFCDTFGNDEQSLLDTSDDTAPFDFVPLNVASAGSSKYDLTNAYYAGNDVDMIMCAAMERISNMGASYVDFEFPQVAVWKTIAEGCTAEIYYTQKWKCLYPLRSNGDLQISFNLGNAAERFSIKACVWDTSIVPGDGGCGDGNWRMIYEAISTDGSPILSGPIKGALNQQIIQASPFQFIYRTNKEPYYQDTIPIGSFLETCIDWRALNASTMCYDGLIVKTKASPTGSLKDTGGVIPFNICGNENMTHSPSNPPPTNPPSKNPTRAPIYTQHPTVNPTVQTAPPTWNPSVSPTNPTFTPTVAPSQSTLNPSRNPTISPTFNPTQSPSNPTNNPITASPTASPITASPTGIPTTSDPTTATPTNNPTSTNPTRPPSASPTLQPSQPTNAPVINTDPTVSPNTNAPTTTPISPTTSPVVNTDPTTAPVINTDPTVSPVINGDPTTAPITISNTDPTTSPNTNPATAPVSDGNPTATPTPTLSPSIETTNEDDQGEDEGLGSQPDKKSNVGMIIGIVGALLVLCCCLLFGALFWFNKRNKEKEDALDAETHRKLANVASTSHIDGELCDGTTLRTPSSNNRRNYENDDEDDDDDDDDDEEDYYDDDDDDDAESDAESNAESDVSDLEKDVEMADLKKNKKVGRKGKKGYAD